MPLMSVVLRISQMAFFTSSTRSRKVVSSPTCEIVGAVGVVAPIITSPCSSKVTEIDPRFSPHLHEVTINASLSDKSSTIVGYLPRVPSMSPSSVWL
ncbi:hypothetical protein V8C40DRAFT_251827 [Trichoderma camerunense]